MPVTLPGLSVTKSAELLQTQNKIIKSFPEVASVFGKAGRAATATDPAAPCRLPRLNRSTAGRQGLSLIDVR